MELNEKQQEVLKKFRSEWVEYEREVDQAKEYQKGLFESLWEALGWDKKERGDDIKAVKAGFKIYYKDVIKETEALAEDAVLVASL